MREPATIHLQSLVSEKEHAALLSYQQVTITAKSPSGTIRELLAFALTELGWLDESSNGNITKLVRQNNKPKQSKKIKQHETQQPH